MLNLDESSLTEELGLDRRSIIKDQFKTTDLVVHKSVFRLSQLECDNVKGKKLDFGQMSKENDKTIALRIKQDLESLTFVLKRNNIASENDDHPLLMVHFSWILCFSFSISVNRSA